MQEIYDVGDTVYGTDLKELTDAEVLELAANLRKGVPIATPVFDGANEVELKKLLDLLICMRVVKSPFMMVAW